MVSSASSRRLRSAASCEPAERPTAGPAPRSVSIRPRPRVPCESGIAAPQVQADENALRAGQIADDLPERLRDPPHEGRYRDDLVVAGESRVLKQVHDADAIA